MLLRVELSDSEGNRLRRLMKATRDVVVLRRAMVAMQSAQGYAPPRIGELMGLHLDYVREIVKAFTAGGFDSLNPRWGGSRTTSARRSRTSRRPGPRTSASRSGSGP